MRSLRFWLSWLALAALLLPVAPLSAQGPGAESPVLSPAEAPPVEAWVARYNGLGNGNDYGQALAVDTSGNVYVTGYSLGAGTGPDYATIKYDSQGNMTWEARYNGPADGSDWGAALAVDGAGNVYVTGLSVGLAEDYATIKYDSNGNQLWVARYHGPGNGTDGAEALAVDASGNVYVTGLSEGAGTGYDYATIKYDTSGSQLWVARYNGPGNIHDFARALALDGAGNVYVTGYSWGGDTTGVDYATIKYDANGNQLWVARYNSPTDGWDYAQALTLDGTGNVYVTGYSAGWLTSYDYATIKYDSGGNQLWVARYNGPGNGMDYAYAIALDTGGNVYVTGYSGGVNTDYATIKYDSNGNQLWVARYNGSGNGQDAANALALDTGGNVYVTGFSTGVGTAMDYATIKYVQPAPPLQATTALRTAEDTDKAAGTVPGITGIVEAQLGQRGPVAVKSYSADLTYAGNLLQVLEVRLKPPFDTGEASIDNPGGKTTFSASAANGTPPPIDPLAFLTLRLTGTVTDSVQVTLTFSQIADTEGNPITQQQPFPQRTYQRGDAKADGSVNIADALYIASYLGRLKEVGEGLTKVHAVNAASVKHDGVYDRITIADLLLLAQYIVGLRNPDMTAKAAGIR